MCCPNHPFLRETRGQIFFKMGQYTEAIADLEFALAGAPQLRNGDSKESSSCIRRNRSARVSQTTEGTAGQRELAEQHQVAGSPSTSLRLGERGVLFATLTTGAERCRTATIGNGEQSTWAFRIQLTFVWACLQRLPPSLAMGFCRPMPSGCKPARLEAQYVKQLNLAHQLFDGRQDSGLTETVLAASELDLCYERLERLGSVQIDPWKQAIFYRQHVAYLLEHLNSSSDAVEYENWQSWQSKRDQRDWPRSAGSILRQERQVCFQELSSPESPRFRESTLWLAEQMILDARQLSAVQDVLQKLEKLAQETERRLESAGCESAFVDRASMAGYL